MGTGYKNPLLLTGRKPVTVEKIPKGGKVAADVRTDPTKRPHNICTIRIYSQRAKEMYQKSPYYSLISYQTFELCLLYHEVSHILSQRFDILHPFGNFVMDYIANCLDDQHDEYWMMSQFPNTAKYIQLLLSCLKWATPSFLKGKQLEIDLNTVFLMTRFGVVRPGADPALVRFVLPLMLSSMRGHRRNTINAGLAIYEYLYYKHVTTGSDDDENTWMQAMAGGEQEQEALTDEEIQQIMQGAQVNASGNYEALKTALDAQGNPGQDKLAGGMMAGVDGPPPSKEEQSEEFYNWVTQMYASVIIELRNLFIQSKQKVFRKLGWDGPLHPRKRHLKWHDLVSGEDHRTAVTYARTKPWIELAVLCDVSGSTSGIMNLYAAAVVCFLAALEGIYDVKTALVNFNSYYDVVMPMGNQISKTRVYPQSSGGTVLAPALDELANANGANQQQPWLWLAREKFIVVITDGGISGWAYDCLPRLKKFFEDGFTIVVVDITTFDDENNLYGAYNQMPDWIISIRSTLERLPMKLMDALVGVVA